jgi:hypothetical protein
MRKVFRIFVLALTIIASLLFISCEAQDYEEIEKEKEIRIVYIQHVNEDVDGYRQYSPIIAVQTCVEEEEKSVSLAPNGRVSTEDNTFFIERFDSPDAVNYCSIDNVGNSLHFENNRLELRNTTGPQPSGFRSEIVFGPYYHPEEVTFSAMPLRSRTQVILFARLSDGSEEELLYLDLQGSNGGVFSVDLEDYEDETIELVWKFDVDADDFAYIDDVVVSSEDDGLTDMLCSVLPVQLVSFGGKSNENCTITASFSYQEPVNSIYQHVYYSFDGALWYKAATFETSYNGGVIEETITFLAK